MIGEEVIAVYGDAGDGEELFEVQKLVRCKECKHWRGYCGHLNGLMNPEEDDFCSVGERKESE